MFMNNYGDKWATIMGQLNLKDGMEREWELSRFLFFYLFFFFLFKKNIFFLISEPYDILCQ